MSLQGQIALVTGASRGIGKAIAAGLAARGATVIGTATTDTGSATITEALKAYQSITSSYLNCGKLLDVNDSAACDHLVEWVVKEYGALNILVNNAGITRDTLAVRMKNDDWQAVIDTNLTAVFRMARAVIRPMMKQRAGRIINITSVVGSSGNAGQANYAAAKAGVAGMTRALARELGSRQITVNCVAPGFIETDMTAALDEQQTTALLQNIALGRLGKPEDIAHAVAFLASAEAAYISGTTLHVNGGMYMN